jgi:hypothetical protein
LARSEKDDTVKAPTRPRHVTWLLLAYRLPVNSGMKGTVRRRLTAVGAAYPANAIAVLPESPAAERAFRRLRSMIGEAGGSAQVLRAEAIEGEPDLVAVFNTAREQEYAEIIAGCGDVIAGIEAMTAAGRFRHADLEEKETALKGLSMRHEEIRARDWFGASNARSAVSSLVRCHAVLNDFAKRVYKADAASDTGIGTGRPERRTR